MSDDDSYDAYGDTDPNNVPDGGFGQDTSAGDGLPGFPGEGYPGWRAGVFGSGNGLLGMARVSDLVAQPDDDASAMLQFGGDQASSGAGDPRLLLAANPGSTTATGQSDPLPPAYMPDGHGGVQLKPGFAATHPKGPLDFGGMSKEIDWPGVALDMGSIAASSLPLAGAKAVDVLKAIPGWGLDTWRELHHDAQPKKGPSAT